MFPMALVCGNTMLVKPSERDPGATMILMELCREAGIPPGVVNVIHGAHDCKTTFPVRYIYGLVQDCSISIANALEILQSGTKPCQNIPVSIPEGLNYQRNLCMSTFKIYPCWKFWKLTFSKHNQPLSQQAIISTNGDQDLCIHMASPSTTALRWSNLEYSGLKQWGRDKMATIFQATVSNAFSWVKIYWFRLRFHSSLFPRVQLTIFQHWFR